MIKRHPEPADHPALQDYAFGGKEWVSWEYIEKLLYLKTSITWNDLGLVDISVGDLVDLCLALKGPGYRGEEERTMRTAATYLARGSGSGLYFYLSESGITDVRLWNMIEHDGSIWKIMGGKSNILMRQGDCDEVVES